MLAPANIRFRSEVRLVPRSRTCPCCSAPRRACSVPPQQYASIGIAPTYMTGILRAKMTLVCETHTTVAPRSVETAADLLVALGRAYHQAGCSTICSRGFCMPSPSSLEHSCKLQVNSLPDGSQHGVGQGARQLPGHSPAGIWTLPLAKIGVAPNRSAEVSRMFEVIAAFVETLVVAAFFGRDRAVYPDRCRDCFKCSWDSS